MAELFGVRKLFAELLSAKDSHKTERMYKDRTKAIGRVNIPAHPYTSDTVSVKQGDCSKMVMDCALVLSNCCVTFQVVVTLTCMSDPDPIVCQAGPLGRGQGQGHCDDRRDSREL